MCLLACRTFPCLKEEKRLIFSLIRSDLNYAYIEREQVDVASCSALVLQLIQASLLLALLLRSTMLGSPLKAEC